LLTGWHQNGAVDFSLDEEKFQACTGETQGAPIIPTTGGCIAGGRVGYSVKLVAKDYLLSGDLELGGEGAGSGALQNPPPQDF